MMSFQPTTVRSPRPIASRANMNRYESHTAFECCSSCAAAFMGP